MLGLSSLLAFYSACIGMLSPTSRVGLPSLAKASGNALTDRPRGVSPR